MKLETKYNVGDYLFVASYDRTEERYECPDCLGTRKWTVVAPSRATWEVGCHTCYVGFQSHGFLTRDVYRPRVLSHRVTDIEVRTEGAVTKVLYYSSGNGRYEPDLFRTREDAFEAAKFVAARAQQQFDENVYESQEKARKKEVRKPWAHERTIKEQQREIERLKKLLRGGSDGKKGLGKDNQ